MHVGCQQCGASQGLHLPGCRMTQAVSVAASIKEGSSHPHQESPMSNKDEMLERLTKREHHFRNAIEGEYDANLFRQSRFAIEALSAEVARKDAALREIAGAHISTGVDPLRKVARAALNAQSPEQGEG